MCWHLHEISRATDAGEVLHPRPAQDDVHRMSELVQERLELRDTQELLLFMVMSVSRFPSRCAALEAAKERCHGFLVRAILEAPSAPKRVDRRVW